MITVVFDTVIFVRSLINPRSRWGRLVFEQAARYRLVVSEPIMREALEVLRRPELVRLFRTLPGRSTIAVIDLLAGAKVVDLDDIPAVSRDPKDDKFLATARVAGADYLVTEDDDLLVLGAYEGVQIVTAATFLQVLEGQEAELS